MENLRHTPCSLSLVFPLRGHERQQAPSLSMSILCVPDTITTPLLRTLILE